MQSYKLGVHLFCSAVLTGFEFVVQGLGMETSRLSAEERFEYNDEPFVLRHGDVVLAAIASCTNSSNPSAMLAAGLFKICFLSLYCISSSITKRLPSGVTVQLLMLLL